VTALEVLADAAASAGVLLDVDGTLSHIVERPELSELAAGAGPVLSRLVDRYRVVAAISGRTQAELERLVDVDGVRLIGSYGLTTGSVPAGVVAGVRAAADAVEGAWVEVKGASIAVHYRAAADADAAASRLTETLAALAMPARMTLAPGKRVIELVPAGHPLKAGAVDRIIDEAGLRAALYAGDDVADIGAFEALHRARGDGRLDHAITVAVRGDETPDALVQAADVVVDGPAQLIDLLRTL
jgi:trehalose 6-phosphate phosphatase